MTARAPSTLPPLPYFAAFVAAPFAVLAGKLAGRQESFQAFGPQGLAVWLLLSGVALLFFLGRAWRTRALEQRPAWPVALLGALLALAAWLLFRRLALVLPQAEELLPLLFELRLPALVFFALLWSGSFGAPKPESLARAGALLGALCVLDFLLTAIMAHSLVLGGGYLFGEAEGTADTLALLLATALCATLEDAPASGSPRLARWLIVAGILATFSRPGLAACALVTLLLDRGPLRQRLALAGICATAVWMALTLPLPRMAPAGDLDLSWYTAATGEALAQEPGAWLTGLPLDSPMALAMPESQGLLWDADTDGVPVSVFEIPASGLRLLAAWGLGAPLAVLAGALFCAWRGRSRFGYGLCLVLALGALVTPVLHTPASAVALALALISAARRQPQGDGQARPE